MAQRKVNYRMRERLSRVAVVLGAVLFALAALLGVVERSLFDSPTFGARVAESLSDPRVSSFAANAVTDALLRANPDLVAARPLISGAANELVTMRSFRAVVGQAAQRAHGAVFSEGSRRLVLSLPDFGILLKSALAQASPELAGKIPENLKTVLASPDKIRYFELVVEVWRTGQRLLWLERGLFLLGPLLLAFSVWISPGRRRAIRRLGMGLVVAGLALACLLPAGSVVSYFVIEDAAYRDFVAGLWATFFAKVRAWGLLFAGVGILFWAGAASWLESVDPFPHARQIARWIYAPPLNRGWRFLWGLSLFGVGLLVIAFPVLILSGLVVAGGLWLSYLGARELFRLLYVPTATEVQSEEPRAGWAWLIRAGAALALVLVVGALLLVWRNRVQPGPQQTAALCNGSARLCDLPVDKVVFAGAHNAMSNEEAPEWMFPHHQAGIPRQLRDGVRALLIDVHYGFEGAARIKTDLTMGMSRERLESAVGKEGYEAALRIRNRLIGAREERRDLYLCHGFCELGGYKLEPALAQVRSFLVENPDEVLLLIIEDYVTPEDLRKAFERTGLGEFVYRGPSGPPWPTLGELIRTSQRVLVFVESGRAGVPWLRPAFASFRETPYSFHKIEEFSCRANRGGDAGALFLMNHWIETAPTPKPSNAAVVNAYDFLLKRVQACAAERGHVPNIIAVDFYRSGSLLEVVRKLNETPSAQMASVAAASPVADPPTSGEIPPRP